MKVLGLLCSAYQRDSLFIHVLLREFYVFVLCCVYVILRSNRVERLNICIIIIIINNTFWGLLLIFLFIISVTI